MAAVSFRSCGSEPYEVNMSDGVQNEFVLIDCFFIGILELKEKQSQNHEISEMFAPMNYWSWCLLGYQIQNDQPTSTTLS